MAEQRTIGNMIAPPQFLAFLAAMIVTFPIASHFFQRWALGAMGAFDVAAALFLISCVSLLGTREARVIRAHATQNDANRHVLLAVTGIVMAVLFTAIAAEAVGHNPQPFTKGLIIGTLALAWVFSNTVYALHYAHLVYMHPDVGCVGLEFPRTASSRLLGFHLLRLHLRNGVCNVRRCGHRNSYGRKTVTIHCLAAFAFNIGVLAFPSTCSVRAARPPPRSPAAREFCREPQQGSPRQ